LKLFLKSDGFTPYHVRHRLLEWIGESASRYLPQRKPHVLRRSTGFSLIEVLIAIVILSVSLLALAGLMATTSQNNSLGGHITEAATFAQDQLERLRVTSWSPGSEMDIGAHNNNITGSSGIPYARNWNVVQTGNIRTVTITVNWNDGVARSFTMISAISQ